MQAKDILHHDVEFSFQIARAHLRDLKDADLLVRPVPGANHLAWQLGHLIINTHDMILAVGQPAPELPAGFDQTHSKDNAASDDPADFDDLATYTRLLDQMQVASLAAIAAFPAEKLADPGPEAMRAYLPTNASVLSVLGSHWMMHVGQFSVIRRKLGHPPIY